MLHLVDASYFIFRAYYSVAPDMAGRDGQAVNALYGYARFLGDLLERASPVHAAAAFDTSLTSGFRNRLYPAYKANREPAPPDLQHQFELCRELTVLLGVADFASEEYEADDLIGALAKRMRGHGLCSVLITRDKDLAQLIAEGDHFWDYAGDLRLAYGDIEGRFGVRPERIADYLALTGDAVDNIPGVPGIGPKAAAALLGHFESLDDLYARLDEVPALPMRGAARAAALLAEHRDAAFLARSLTRIACDLPMEVAPEALERRVPDLEGLDQFYDRAGFGTLLRRQARRIAERMS